METTEAIKKALLKGETPVPPIEKLQLKPNNTNGIVANNEIRGEKLVFIFVNVKVNNYCFNV
jgi:hypothetical protein